MDNNKKLEGVEMLYYLITRFNMTYNNAIREMVKHKQDMKFLDKLKANDLNNNNINLSK